MKEHSIKSVRLTPTVKARLDTFKGSDTVSVCVDRMITFFEITGFNLRYASKNPTALVEKRIEDLIKIIKSQERDIFKPILEKLAGMGGGLHESPDYARLMNEMHDLQERNRKLQQQLAEYGEGSPADVEKEREKLRRLAELIKFQLNPDKFPKVKFSDDVKVPVSTLQLLIKKINEEYVL
jgi:hypothetical protein